MQSEIIKNESAKKNIVRRNKRITPRVVVIEMHAQLLRDNITYRSFRQSSVQRMSTALGIVTLTIFANSTFTANDVLHDPVCFMYNVKIGEPVRGYLFSHYKQQKRIKLFKTYAIADFYRPVARVDMTHGLIKELEIVSVAFLISLIIEIIFKTGERDAQNNILLVQLSRHSENIKAKL